MDSFADTLKGFAQSMYAVADGNLNVEINLLDSEDQISPALQKTVKSLQDLKSETGYLTTSALEGKLKARGDLNKFKADIKKSLMA